MQNEISVIVPCLNEEKLLPFFLNSLEDQVIYSVAGCSRYDSYGLRLFPFELVVVDGGSSDRSRSLIDSYRSRFAVTGLIDDRKNLGIVRNRGALAATTEILFFTNSDAILPRNILSEISSEFKTDLKLIALAGRTVPIKGGIICTAAYTAFDFLRWLFTKLGKFSPGGNFLAVRSSIFHDVGGFHALRVNEDGELGNRLSEYAQEQGGKIKFRLDLHVHTNSKRFQGNPFRALLFYAYVFGNFSPVLRKILQPIEHRSSRKF